MQPLNKKEGTPQIPPELILWDKDTVKQVIGWKSDTALYRAMKDLKFPEPVKIGIKKSMWRKQRVLDWMASLEEGVGKCNAIKH